MYNRLSLLAAALLLCCGASAESITLTIKDLTGRGFPPDLVNYSIAAPADNGKNLRVLDSEGKSLPLQVTPAGNGQATLSFIASVAPNGTSTYTVRDDGQGESAKSAVSANKDSDAMVLANQLLAVKVPAPQEKSFDKTVAADTLPPPIIAFRGPDGTWKGEGKLLLKRPVKKFTVAQAAGGPVFNEISYRLDYAEGGWYEAKIRVTDSAPFAQVSESYDMGIDTNREFWQLDLSKGWKPDAAEHMSVAGQGNRPVQFPSLADEEKVVASGPSVGANFAGGGEGPVRCIHHDSCWGEKFVSYYGIHSAEARKANPASYPVAIVAPLHKGDWRRSSSLPIFVKGGEVRVFFPMATWPTSWKDEPRSDVSPFSCHEHDPSLPTTYGRRNWALVLAQPALKITGYNDKSTAEGAGYSIRVGYGEVGLDRYKDFILNWTDGKVQYPRVFITTDEVKKYREAVKADPAFPLLSMINGYYWFTGDPETAKKELPEVHKRLDDNIKYIMTSLSIHHHHTLDAYGTPVGHTESVLSWPDLPSADREAIRAKLALLCYLLVEPDVTSAGDGSHHGNPNMGVSRLQDRANLAALVPDHPMHKTWSEYMAMFMAYKQGTFMAPEGGWFEYGASYHMHGYGKILRGMMGTQADKVSTADRIWSYNRTDFDYYMNLLSPFDPRYGARTIPGSANSAVGNPPHFLQAMGSVADKDPEFAANLRWAWENGGRMVATGADAITIPAMARPEIPAKEPKLTSRIYPGYGVIFRAHQGPDETCLYLRSGYLWSHWNQDQGNMMLYSKGAVLLPSQPYQYGGPKDNSFPDKNFIRFGDPTNDFPHDWGDSNIIDANFAGSADYAWASSGYPDWFINPAGAPGWEKANVRKLVGGMDQKEGAFWWDRQVIFLKGATAKAPNYFVIRDSFNGDGKLASWFNLSLLGRKGNLKIEGAKVAVDTEWPTKLDMIFTGRDKFAFEMQDDNLPVQFGPYNRLTEQAKISRDWLDKEGRPAVADGKGGCNVNAEQHVTLRLQSAPGQEVAWVLYPRGEGENSPTVSQLDPGVTKIVTAEGTDYVFLSTKPMEYKGEDVEFSGLAGAVRVAKDGKATFVLSAGPGKVGYKGSFIESPVPFEKTVAAGTRLEPVAVPTWSVSAPSAMAGGQKLSEGVTKASADGVTQYAVDAPSALSAADGDVKLHARKAFVEISKDKVRFVVPERAYAQLSAGNIGVRGVGPFDLTFTPDGISGKVDGAIRTIVTTWPHKIIRPSYWMDGVRWYAGFADEHSLYKGTKTPQFAVAMGVSAGAHEVKITEWEWPPMPQPPPRTSLSLK